MVPLEQSIRTPDDLSRIIRLIKRALDAGELREIDFWPKYRVSFHRPPFSAIPEEGPWPDYMEYYFESPVTGQCFRLVCEIYHGSGGQWEKYDCAKT